MPGNVTTTTTQTLQTTQSLMQQVGTQLQNSVFNQQYNLGSFVTNVSILPYIPSATIKFEAHGLKPNTRLYAYFGNTPVSAWCAPLKPGYDINSIDASQLTYPYGTALYSDSTGSCSGIFRIPENRFQSQEIIFKLLDISDLVQGEDAITTEADGTYYGSTLSVAKGQSLLNTRQTVLSSTEIKQQKTVDGLALRTDITPSYVEDPPPPQGGGGGGSGCGCGCFTENTMVELASGVFIEIKNIKIGDKVFNRDRTSINTVKFIEIVDDRYFEKLYSPSSKYEAFATVNHPIYIDGELASVDPEQNYNWYPWLGKNKKIEITSIIDAKNENVYNLWVDGDGTYTVNGYGTSSIVGDGGLLRVIFEQGLISRQEATDLMFHYMTAGKPTMYGIYLVNKFLGKYHNKFLNKLLVDIVLTRKDNGIKTFIPTFNFMFKVVGKAALLTK
jgi:hypothetical protein